MLVVAEDDDLIPPLFAAEAIIGAKSGKALLLSARVRSKVFLRLEGMEMGVA
jgi:hypothetical protein